MRLLLDTHIWLWSLGTPDRLSDRVAAELSNADSEVWLSPISVWEALLLIAKGRMAVQAGPREWAENALRAASTREASLTHEIVIRSQEIVLPHKDPADHFLVATAQVYDLTLVTSDTLLQQAPDCAVLTND